MITKCKLQIARAPKVLIGIPQNFPCEFSFVCYWNCSMLLLLSKKVVKLQSRLCDFVSNFQISRRACYSFWGRPSLVIYRWNFVNPCKDFGARAKKNIFWQLPIDILSGRTFYEGVWGCPLNLQPHNCRLFLNRVFKDGGWRPQVRSVQFSLAVQRRSWWSWRS